MLSLITVNQANGLIHNFNWHNPSWDLFIFLFWVVAAVIYAFTAGRGRIINILISVYMSKLLVIEAPFLTQELSKRLPQSVFALQQLITFVILFLLLFLFLGRYAFRTSADGRHLGSVVFGLIFSFLQIGLLINIILTFLPASTQGGFSDLVQTVFIKNPASFIWLIIPLVYLIILGKHVADPNEI